MKMSAALLSSVLAGAAFEAAFYGYWIAAWIAMSLLAFGASWAPSAILAGAGAYLGGVLFHLLALGWMRCALTNAEALTLVHYFAVGWTVTVVIVRALPTFPLAVTFPIAWTLGAAAPAAVLSLFVGPPGWFYLNRVAATQLAMPLVQIADLSGMAGVEFVMAAMAGALVEMRMRSLVVCALLLAASVTYGLVRTRQAVREEYYRAALYQSPGTPNIDTLVDVAVWPEGDRWQDWTDDQWRNFARESGGAVVVGASRVAEGKTYNCALLATDDQVRYVDKRYLVLGGETPSPVDWVLGIAHKKDLFQAGAGPVNCDCNGISIVVCTCYEVTIPGLVDNATGLIVNPGSERRIACANGPQSMLDHARLRAIESRRPLVRAVLGGYTAIIDGNGAVVGATVDQPLVGEVPADSRFSFYSATGNWVTPLCAILAAVLYIRARSQT